MSSSDAGSSVSKPGRAGKPADQVWQCFHKVYVKNANGQSIEQGHSNRSHRLCKGCGTEFKSCTVKVGEDHLLHCKKALASFPDLKKTILESRAGKAEAKDPQSLLVKRQFEQSLMGTIPLPKEREAAAINAALLDMLVMCNVSFNVVQSAWFKRFCGIIRPGFVPQCKLTC